MELSLQENEIEPADFSVAELNQIREKIESMSKFNQVEVLRILNTYSSVLNENKYGVHINLSELKPEIIEHLQKYIHYVNTQELTLNQVEKQKENFKNTYFTNAKDTIKNEKK
jgi:hypothetical protein